jgi:hypothetical protein
MIVTSNRRACCAAPAIVRACVCVHAMWRVSEGGQPPVDGIAHHDAAKHTARKKHTKSAWQLLRSFATSASISFLRSERETGRGQRRHAEAAHDIVAAWFGLRRSLKRDKWDGRATRRRSERAPPAKTQEHARSCVRYTSIRTVASCACASCRRLRACHAMGSRSARRAARMGASLPASNYELVPHDLTRVRVRAHACVGRRRAVKGEGSATVRQAHAHR